MKKHLLATSAIALGVAAAPAAAQDWNLDWGGYYNTHVTYTDVSGSAISNNFPGTDFDGLSIIGDGEIFFTPSVTLDNGMTFGINVQLEAQNATGTQIDESYVTISSDTLGRIELGGENSAGYKAMVGAPSVGSFAITSASVSAAAPITNPFRQAGGTASTEVGGNNDVQRISYYTPSFNGLTVGVSYAPDGTTNAANSGGLTDRNAIALKDVFDIGLNYSQSFGTTDVTVGARWGTGDNNGAAPSDPETWGLGLQVGFGAFTVGGHYAENDNGAAGGVAPGVGASDQEGWSLGATYDIAGPWSVGLTGFQGTAEAGAIDSEYNAYKLAGSRELGAGVSWDVYAIYAENKAGTAHAGGFGVAPGEKVEATIIGTSINLSF